VLGSVRFCVTYHRGSDLVRDHDTQLAHRGLLVKVEPPEGIELYDAASLEIALGDERVAIEGKVVQMIPSFGVAIAFDAAPPELARLVAHARAFDGSDRDPEHLRTDDGLEDRAEDVEEPEDHARPTAASAAKAEKIKLALHGSRDERLRVLRDKDRTLHLFVLKNPQLGLDEVLSIAKNPQTAPDALKSIAEKREWYQRSDIALALLSNPKTPVPLAIRMIEHTAIAELRRLAKTDSLRPAVLNAVRKKVISK
jgi:hypothetical protein